MQMPFETYPKLQTKNNVFFYYEKEEKKDTIRQQLDQQLFVEQPMCGKLIKCWSLLVVTSKSERE